MFNLENAIRGWKKELAGKPALDETYISELEAVLRDEIADRVRGGESEEAAFRASSAGMGDAGKIGSEFSKVRRPRGWGLRLRRFVMPDLLWNYVRVSLRKIRRQKGYSAITIAGLAVGLACCTLMMLWVRDETSYDRFHTHRNSIYRLITETKSETGLSLSARAATPLGPILKAELPEVADFSRYQSGLQYGLSYGDKKFTGDSIALADPAFFTIFSFPFLKGDPKTALADPGSIVISESLARKCFGSDEPMGKTLGVAMERAGFVVTGVIRDVPPNSHLRFEAMIPAAHAHQFHHVDFENWKSTFFHLYVRLAPNTDPAEAGRKISGLLAAKNPEAKSTLRPQALGDVHLKSNFSFDFANSGQGSASTLLIFSLAAAAVLLLACINFMNLATARSANRGKEVGLRKVTGARRSDLIKQFLGESVVLSLISLGFALALAELVLPLFNSLTGKTLTFGRLLAPDFLPLVLAAAVITGLLAGSYPALFLSSFQPAQILKAGPLAGGRGPAVLRKSLVIVQFALTVFLVIGTLVVDRQLKFIRAKNLGIDTHQVLTTQAAPGWRDAVLSNPSVLSLSFSTTPGQDIREVTSISWDGKDSESVIPFLPAVVDEEYLKTFRLRMTDGRFFSRDHPSDRTESVVINETAARFLGPGSPLGKRLTYSRLTNQGTVENRALIVIGVINDFHQKSLHRAIEPMFFMYAADSFACNIRISESNVAATLDSLEKKWRSLFPNFPFAYSFIDDQIDGFYQSEQKVKTILGIFAALALFTACLGLIGLASFIAEKKTKEIGIRKVLGASIGGIVVLQTREFVLWVLLANALAWPAAYYAVGRWLQGFAYRIRPGFELGALAAGFSLAIAILAVGYKAVRAAHANPVDSLKYE